MNRRLHALTHALLLAGALAAAWPSLAAAGDDGEPPRAKGMTTSVEAQPIKALHYGDTLFNFFQDKYFSAITALMTSQHFDRLAPQAACLRCAPAPPRPGH